MLCAAPALHANHDRNIFTRYSVTFTTMAPHDMTLRSAAERAHPEQPGVDGPERCIGIVGAAAHGQREHRQRLHRVTPVVLHRQAVPAGPAHVSTQIARWSHHCALLPLLPTPYIESHCKGCDWTLASDLGLWTGLAMHQAVVAGASFHWQLLQ